MTGPMAGSVAAVAAAASVRVQLRRTKGWRLPAGAVVVSRPSVWGNPWRHGTALARVPALDGGAWEPEGRISAAGTGHDFHHPDGTVTRHHVRLMTRAECAEAYRRALLTPTRSAHLPDGPAARGLPWLDAARARADLAGRDLACWCPPTPPGEPAACHADVLIAVANRA